MDTARAWSNELAAVIGETEVRVPAPGIFPPPAGPGPDPDFAGSTFSLREPSISRSAAQQLMFLAIQGNDPINFGDLLAKSLIVLLLEGFTTVSGDYSGICTFLPQPPPPNNLPVIIPPVLYPDKDIAITVIATQISLWCAPCLFVPTGLVKGPFVVPPVPAPFGAFVL